ncbi:urease accessory protein [Gracilibacillus oryzae]|uniref:Urease accessory protein UreF n=1 Tax=Gracilibacillus oryzae TaxID=1672701 RepID=A0A7C8L9D7_9BACI|nr:urease accessory UreF family protein [Gracilibacillus oryzae]KAB8138912.1 urease accessory protein [Gracilibacillus oryzae]
MSTGNSNNLMHLLHLHHSSFLKSQVAHAIGMEMYIRSKQINSKADLASFCKSYIGDYLLYNDAIMIKEIFVALKKDDWDKIIYLSSIYNARKTVLEIKKSSRQAGNRLAERMQSIKKSPLFEKWEENINEKNYLNHYLIVYSIYAYENDFDLYLTIQSYLYFALTNLVEHAIRVIPLAPKEGETVIFDLLEELNETANNATHLTLNDMVNSAIGLEISAMQHKYLLSKLFL